MLKNKMKRNNLYILLTVESKNILKYFYSVSFNYRECHLSRLSKICVEKINTSSFNLSFPNLT